MQIDSVTWQIIMTIFLETPSILDIPPVNIITVKSAAERYPVTGSSYRTNISNPSFVRVGY